VIRELVGGFRVEGAGIERQAVGLARVEIQLVAEIHQVADGGGTGSHPGKGLAGLPRVDSVDLPSAEDRVEPA
jgi:hypothetical protein